MSIPARIYETKTLTKVAELFQGIEDLYREFEPGVDLTKENPLYIWSTEIVIRHKDGWTVGRIGMDDFLFFEITDENYGDPTQVDKDDRDLSGTAFGAVQP